MKFINDLFNCVFGNGSRCYYCQRPLKVSVGDFLDKWFKFYYPLRQPYKVFRCPKGHIEYSFILNTDYYPRNKKGELLYVVYRIGKYRITRYYNDLYGYKTGYHTDDNVFHIRWKKNQYENEYVNLPIFDIEKLTHEQVLKKIRLYLIFS